MNREETIKEIENRYGSVSSMVNVVQNEILRLQEHEGYFGCDRGVVAEKALRIIPSAFHNIYYQYAFTTNTP